MSWWCGKWWGGWPSIYWWGVIIAVGIKFPGDVYVQDGVGLGIWVFPGTQDNTQEVGCHNHPQWTRNKLFLKLFQVLICVVSIEKYMPIKLEDIKSGEGLIYDNRIKQQGGVEVITLSEHPLLSWILCSSCLNGILCIVDITQKKCGGGGGGRGGRYDTNVSAIGVHIKHGKVRK